MGLSSVKFTVIKGWFCQVNRLALPYPLWFERRAPIPFGSISFLLSALGEFKTRYAGEVVPLPHLPKTLPQYIQGMGSSQGQFCLANPVQDSSTFIERILELISLSTFCSGKPMALKVSVWPP